MAQLTITDAKQQPFASIVLDPLLPNSTGLTLQNTLFEPASISTASSQIEDPLTFGPLVTDSEDASTELRVVGKLLNYPNPFSFSSGGTEIGYRLSKAADINIDIYTLTGYKIFSEFYPKGTQGGVAAYNRVPIQRANLRHADLNPGVYLYVLTNQGKVLAKNRMVVLP